MRSFSRFLFFLLAALVVINLILPIHYGLPYPDQLGPTFDDAIRGRYIKYIDDEQVRLVLVGDSALDASVDASLLSAATETPSYVIAIPGSISAFWYLAIKNLILNTKKKNRPCGSLFS